ncbi:MAG: PD40 domain-containing protein, partial [Nitrospinae bacterium]|nr:PD40 domain-containing protein [Nitrospinota bacterium]
GWDIWSVRPDGSELTRITKWSRNEYSPHPTSDGKGVLYVSTAGGDHAIWSMDINGDNPRRLTSGGTGDWFPSMNPNGREIVFVSTRLGYGDIWTIDTVEKKYHRLTYSDLPEFSPAWSPDGSKIAYVTNKGGEFDIWIMDRDGKNKRRLTKGISDRNWGNRFSAIKIMETAGYYHLSWHPDGTKILFTEWGDNEKESCISILDFDKAIIDRLEADGTSIPEYTLIGEGELTKGEWEDFAPSFSPDGISLTFSSNRSGNWNIWSMEFNGENLRQLTDEKADALAPVFSPDGKEIAYLKMQDARGKMQDYDLWIMKSDGSGARQVTKDIPVISYPAWNPNGKEIAFVAQGKDGTEIWTYARSGNGHYSRVRSLNASIMGMGEFSGESSSKLPLSINYPFIKFLYRIGYNPAGDKITFESNRSGNVEIWTMRSDGTNLARITNGDSPHWNPIWSPDGKMIAYTTDKLGEKAGHHNWRNYNIWVADPETHEEMLITGEEQIDWNPVWSPDGKKIVYVTNRSGDFKHFNLWVLYLK